MIKRFLVAAAMVVATPGFLFSQDLFWSFENDAIATTAGVASGTSGSAYLFAAETLPFDIADLNFTSSNSAVVTLLGGAGIDDVFNTVGSTKFDTSTVTIDPTSSGSAGNWLGVNVTQNGVAPSLVQFDPNFVPGVGSLLAQVNYDVSGQAGDTSTLDLSVGIQGIGGPLGIAINPSFGTATLTVVPEPSSAILLTLGSVGLIARRRSA